MAEPRPFMAEPRPQQHPKCPAGPVALPFLALSRPASPRRRPALVLLRRADHHCPCAGHRCRRADRRCPCTPSDNDIDIGRHSHRHRPVTTSTPSDAHPAMPSPRQPEAVGAAPYDGHAVSRKRHNHYHGSHQFCRVGYTCSRVAHRQCRVVHKCFRVRPKLSHGGRRQCKGKHLASGIVIYTYDKSTSNRQLPMSSSNSDGVAISQPRVEVRSTSTLGKDIKKDSNAVSIAISRRRYVSHALQYSLDILA